MKLKKILASATASLFAVSALTVSAGAYDAFLMYTDSSWLWGNWNLGDCAAGDTSITGDGTYTVFVDTSIDGAWLEDEETGEPFATTAMGATVFCIDISDLAADIGLEADVIREDTGIDITDMIVTLTNQDGTVKTVDVDESKLIWGDLEGNGKLRIEIFNEYGYEGTDWKTKEDKALDTSAIVFDDKIAVTFTITGIGGDSAEAPAEAPAEEVAEEAADVNVIPMVGGSAVLFEGSATSANWGQAVKILSTNNDGGVFDASMLAPGCVVEVTYSGAAPELILQSWSGGEGWAKVSPASDDGSVAVFTYDDMIASYKTDDMSLFDQLNVGDTGGDITVTKVVLKAGAGAASESVAETSAESSATNATVAAGDTTAVGSDKASADTGVEGIAVIAALAVIGTGAIIVSKRRK